MAVIFPIAPQYKAAILRRHEKNLSRYPLIKAESDAFLRGREETFSLCLQYLYGHMAAQDVLSNSAGMFASYVDATLQAFDRIEYVRTIPAEIFFPYVLYHRVNSEYLDGSRAFLQGELLPYVQGKTMEQAALAVNYWCYAHATYTPADDRTLGPLAILRRTLGRCGEESVLAVAALRSVGIPARQCYCPRWSHCDDNHAWVEVWIDGTWHYLGACEPEAELDRGWFTAAASRAMRVDTKCWAGDCLYETVNCTSRYTDARLLRVQVTEDGAPVPGACVRFQIVNYSQLYTLWETVTDESGIACFETGRGDLLVFAQHGQKTVLEKVDLRRKTTATLELKADLLGYMTADLVPPEDLSGTVPWGESARHRNFLGLCEAHLEQRRATFSTDAYLRHAALNAPEIQAFLENSNYPQAHKEELLNTLRPKDFVDISCQTLEDALEAAAAARGQYPEAIFRQFVLAPRIADEMLLPERQKMRELFPDGFADPSGILAWMQNHMQILPDEGINNYDPSAFGCLRYRQVPGFAYDMVFVALCRAFCFPARLEAHTGQAQWLDKQGIWHPIHPQKETVKLTLEIPAGKSLRYFEHITLGLWDGGDFTTLQYPDLSMENAHTFSLQPGFYRITVTTRQIDGTASVAIWHIRLQSDSTVQITPPEDQTSQRLKQVPLRLPDGPLQEVLHRQPDRRLLLVFADPGSEPTEHLLREMLECADRFRELTCRILLLVERADALAHPTVQLWKQALPEAEILCLSDLAARAALHRQMQVGDLRLPFAVCADGYGRGVYADANYRIGMAHTLLNIQKLLEERKINSHCPIKRKK